MRTNAPTSAELERYVVARYQRLNRMFPEERQEILVEQVRQEASDRFRSISSRELDRIFANAKWSRVDD